MQLCCSSVAALLQLCCSSVAALTAALPSVLHTYYMCYLRSTYVTIIYYCLDRDGLRQMLSLSLSLSLSHTHTHTDALTAALLFYIYM